MKIKKKKQNKMKKKKLNMYRIIFIKKMKTIKFQIFRLNKEEYKKIKCLAQSISILKSPIIYQNIRRGLALLVQQNQKTFIKKGLRKFFDFNYEWLEIIKCDQSIDQLE